jgi:hypothetical protein
MKPLGGETDIVFVQGHARSSSHARDQQKGVLKSD